MPRLTPQVQVSGKDDVLIVYPMESKTCGDSENVLLMATCVMDQYWPYGQQKDRTLTLPLDGDEVYFMTKSSRYTAEYHLHVSKHSNTTLLQHYHHNHLTESQHRTVQSKSLYYTTEEEVNYIIDINNNKHSV